MKVGEQEEPTKVAYEFETRIEKTTGDIIWLYKVKF